MVDTHVALCHIAAQGRTGSATPTTAPHCTALVYLLDAGVAVWRPMSGFFAQTPSLNSLETSSRPMQLQYHLTPVSLMRLGRVPVGCG